MADAPAIDAARPRRQAVHRRAADRVAPSVRVERAAGRGPARARVRRRVRQLGRGRHRRRARSSSTRAACSTRKRCTRRSARWSRQPARHRDLHARPHRPRVRRRPLRGGGARRTAGRAPRVIAHEAIADALRALPADGGLQRGDQPAAVPAAGTALADRVPLSRRDVPRRARRSTVGGEAFELLPRPRRDRRRARGCGRRRARIAVRGRHVHLGVAELRQPAEGAALRARLGGRVPQDGRARARGAAARARAADRRRATGCSRRSTEGAELLEIARRADARVDERGRAPRRHRAHGARARASARAAVPARRSTTSPSSSCATSGGSTAAGTTATRRT